MHHNIPRRAIGSLGLRQRVHLTIHLQRFSCFPLSKYNDFSVHELTGVTNTQSSQRISRLRSLQLGTAIPASPACPARQASQHSQPETLSDWTNFKFRTIRTSFLSGSGSGHSTSPWCPFGTNGIAPKGPSERYLWASYGLSMSFL